MRTQNKLKIGTHNAQFICLVDAAGGKKRLKFLVLDNENQQTESIATNSTYTPEEIKEKFFGGKSAIAMRNSQWLVTLGKNPHKADLLTILGFSKSIFNYPQWFVTHMEQWQGCSNGEPPSEIKKAYLEERRKNDLRFAMSEACGSIARAGVRGELPSTTYKFFFGCCFETLKSHIENTFTAGMTWENYGSAWHIDHIIPKVNFDMTDWREVNRANHYTNLQALSPADNRAAYCNAKTELELIFANN